MKSLLLPSQKVEHIEWFRFHPEDTKNALFEGIVDKMKLFQWVDENGNDCGYVYQYDAQQNMLYKTLLVLPDRISFSVDQQQWIQNHPEEYTEIKQGIDEFFLKTAGIKVNIDNLRNSEREFGCADSAQKVGMTILQKISSDEERAAAALLLEKHPNHTYQSTAALRKTLGSNLTDLLSSFYDLSSKCLSSPQEHQELFCKACKGIKNGIVPQKVLFHKLESNITKLHLCTLDLLRSEVTPEGLKKGWAIWTIKQDINQYIKASICILSNIFDKYWCNFESSFKKIIGDEETPL
jgi:hypothetical protein